MVESHPTATTQHKPRRHLDPAVGVGKKYGGSSPLVVFYHAVVAGSPRRRRTSRINELGQSADLGLATILSASRVCHDHSASQWISADVTPSPLLMVARRVPDSDAVVACGFCCASGTSHGFGKNCRSQEDWLPIATQRTRSAERMPEWPENSPRGSSRRCASLLVGRAYLCTGRGCLPGITRSSRNHQCCQSPLFCCWPASDSRLIS